MGRRTEGPLVRQVSVRFPEFDERLVRDYEFFRVFTDGGVAIYTGHLVARPVGGAGERPYIRRFRFEPPPGAAVVAHGERHTGPTDLMTGDRGTYVYMGSAMPVTSEGLIAIIDPGLPEWIVERTEHGDERVRAARPRRGTDHLLPPTVRCRRPIRRVAASRFRDTFFRQWCAASMLDKLRPYVPPRFEPRLIGLWYALRPAIRLAFRGRSRYCAVCESASHRFLSHGPASRRRQDVMCPVCLSHDRHRAAWLYLNTRTDLLDGRAKRMLHFAPEAELARRFQRIPDLEYVSADRDSPLAMLRTDITAIEAPDASFDVVYCSHVLEHVPDDRQAMREMFRVLRPGGWALIQVPLSPTDPHTFEDPSVTDPAERERLFWQHDHVRLYGADIADRLAAAGFAVEVMTVSQFVPPEAIERHGLAPGEHIFVCAKPST